MNRSENYKLCKKYLRRQVMIKTTKGTFTGTIVKVDNNKVYLKAARPGNKAHVSFLPFIIPLVLFDLLAIALLETRPFSPFGRC